jgi:predicted nuclease of predicted toxin-antitoxin system
MRLVLDEMHSWRAALALRNAGHDVVAVVDEVGLRGIADEALLEWAANEDRVVVTENRDDFRQLGVKWAAGRRHHPGILLTTKRRFPPTEPDRLVAALDHLLRHPPADLADTVRHLRQPPT